VHQRPRGPKARFRGETGGIPLGNRELETFGRAGAGVVVVAELGVAVAVGRARHRMKDKLSRPACKVLYGLRSQIIEPVFGQIKHDRGFRKFLLRGLDGATAEMSLVFLGHNLLKCLKKAAIPAFLAGISNAHEFMHWAGRLVWQRSKHRE